MINVEKQDDWKLIVTIDNGHVKALEKIVADYNLKGEKEAIGFILSIVVDGEGRPIEVGGTKYVPSASIQNSHQDLKNE